jgi:hypothetical protein
VVLAAEKVLEGLDVGEGGAAALTYVLGLLLLALGSVFVARARHRPLAWLAAGLFAVSLVATVFVAVVDLSVESYAPNTAVLLAWNAMPLAAAAGVGALTLLRDREWLPIAILAAIGQLVLLPPPPFLEWQLEHAGEALAGHAGVLGLALQLVVAYAALTGAAQRA